MRNEKRIWMSNEEKETEVELLKKKAQYFYDKGEPVHLSMKKRFFLNGKILELSSDFMIIDDREDGKTLVFFLEVFNIEAYKKEVRVME